MTEPATALNSAPAAVRIGKTAKLTGSIERQAKSGAGWIVMPGVVRDSE
jgi:hypothetical protein